MTPNVKITSPLAMQGKELKVKRTMLRIALMGADATGDLQKIANASGIAGGIDTLRQMIADEAEIGVIDIAMLGQHVGIGNILDNFSCFNPHSTSSAE